MSIHTAVLAAVDTIITSEATLTAHQAATAFAIACSY